jgi:hypothetical protein
MSFIDPKEVLETIYAAILNLDLASISRLNLELFNHKGHQMGPTLKEEIQGPGCEMRRQ